MTPSSNPNPTWKTVRIPESLRGKKLDEIRAWAREKLHGQDPDLSNADLGAIRDGAVSQVQLRPRKAGFFLPDGTFVEAFDSAPSVGGDLDQAEVTWEQEEKDRAWADEETTRFNKKTCGAPGTNAVRLHWEHGQRIEQYVASAGRPLFRIHTLLDERRGSQGYTLRSHQYASLLYRWKPDPLPEEGVFNWTWQLVDAVLGFSNKNEIRDRIAEDINAVLIPSGCAVGAISQFLRGPREPPVAPWTGDRVFLGDARERLLSGGALSGEQLARLGALLH